MFTFKVERGLFFISDYNPTWKTNHGIASLGLIFRRGVILAWIFCETLRPSVLLVLDFARSKISLHDDCIWYPIQIQLLLALRKNLLILHIPSPVSTLSNRSTLQRWIRCRGLSANSKFAAIFNFSLWRLFDFTKGVPVIKATVFVSALHVMRLKKDFPMHKSMP